MRERVRERRGVAHFQSDQRLFCEQHRYSEPGALDVLALQLVSRARLIDPDPRSDVGTAVYLKILTSFFRPTLVLDRGATEKRRNDLRQSVRTEKYAVLAGEKIVGAHEVVGREEHEKLRTLQQMLTSVCDAERFTNVLEEAYREMWQRKQSQA